MIECIKKYLGAPVEMKMVDVILYRFYWSVLVLNAVLYLILQWSDVS